MASALDSISSQSDSAGETPVVYVIDDDEPMRIALSGLLRSVGTRVETFESCSAFLAFPKYNVPSCLILDVRLQGESGLSLQADAEKLGLQIPILFITAHGDVQMSVRAMKAGAFDFFAKPFRDQDILDAVAHALKRDRERHATQRSCSLLRSCYDSLTHRERDVLGFVLAGLLNKQIASELNLSEMTVKIHRGQVMRKMASRSVADLARKAETLQVAPNYPKSS